MCACALALATAIRGELRGMGCASDAILDLIDKHSLIIAQFSHVIHDIRQEKSHQRIAWTHLVLSAVLSAGGEVGLMPATRRYDVSHTCVIVTVLAVQTGRSSSGTRPETALTIEEAHLLPVRTNLPLPYSHPILFDLYPLAIRNFI